MLSRDFMIRADNRPLEKQPDAFYGIGMDIASNPFLSTMVDSLMPGIMVGNPLIGRPFVSIDSFCVRCGVLSDKLVKRLAVIPVNDLKPSLTTTLRSTYNDSLVALIAM